MQYKDAQKFLENLGIQLVKSDTLKLYLICIDESYVYVTPKDLDKFDMPTLKHFMHNVITEYQASEPYIVYH